MSEDSDNEVTTRLREGGRRGGIAAGLARRQRRQRYLDGEMTRDELAAYRRVLEQAKRAGKRGGVRTSEVVRARRRGEGAQ